MDKKSILTIIILIAIVTSIILIIDYTKGGNGETKDVIQCISDNSQLFVKAGCPACASQKNILGDDLGKFDLTDCADEPEKCTEYGITAIPTWIIDGESYVGVRSIEKLKELTGC